MLNIRFSVGGGGRVDEGSDDDAPPVLLRFDEIPQIDWSHAPGPPVLLRFDEDEVEDGELSIEEGQIIDEEEPEVNEEGGKVYGKPESEEHEYIYRPPVIVDINDSEEVPLKITKGKGKGLHVHWISDDQLPSLGRKSYEQSTSKMFRAEKRLMRKEAFNNNDEFGMEDIFEPIMFRINSVTGETELDEDSPTILSFPEPKRRFKIPKKKTGEVKPDKHRPRSTILSSHEPKRRFKIPKKKTGEVEPDKDSPCPTIPSSPEPKRSFKIPKKETVEKTSEKQDSEAPSSPPLKKKKLEYKHVLHNLEEGPLMTSPQKNSFEQEPKLQGCEDELPFTIPPMETDLEQRPILNSSKVWSPKIPSTPTNTDFELAPILNDFEDDRTSTFPGLVVRIPVNRLGRGRSYQQSSSSSSFNNSFSSSGNSLSYFRRQSSSKSDNGVRSSSRYDHEERRKSRSFIQ